MKKEFSRQISVTTTVYLGLFVRDDFSTWPWMELLPEPRGPVDVVKSATKIYTSFVEASLLFARVHERRIQFMSM